MSRIIFRPGAFVLFAVSLAATVSSRADAPQLRGFLTARGVNATGPPSWTAGGFGRLDLGGTGEMSNYAAVTQAQVGLDWEPFPRLFLSIHGLARNDAEEVGGERSGLVEGFIEWRQPARSGEFRLRGGHFFLPTSRENREALWSSPYTITLSALNSWVAQEFRLTGAEAAWQRDMSSGQMTLAASAFGGNDTSGSLVAWRGWSLGSRLTVHGERLPLPPLHSLDDEFSMQRVDGTRPFGSDLDGRIGHTARLRWQAPSRFSIQIAHADNRGDRELYQGEYAWRTRFVIGSATVQFGDVQLAAEHLRGETGMGDRSGPHVQMEMATTWVMASQSFGSQRFTLRGETFRSQDRDGTAENNDENGRALTAAWMYALTPRVRAGLEFVRVYGDRRAVAESGASPALGAQQVSFEIRYALHEEP